mmetsp:Transcript_25130/g.24061  ORF Transcript_25130/g.24061 Transcript_25130/m.24061 type:complete len:279 (-) Transcript_25130:419-1255(-)
MDLEVETILNNFVPKEILRQIFCEYLTVEDISSLDVAICETKKRQNFVLFIGSMACIWSGNMEENFNDKKISWLRSRNMKIRDLRCDSVTFDVALKIAGFGVYLEWLHIDNRDLSDMSVIKIVEDCPNLKHIGMSSGNITDLSMNRIADCCRHTKSLIVPMCYNITYSSMIRIAERCPNMEVFDLSDCEDITDIGMVRIAECCNIHLLEMRASRITDISAIRIAEFSPNIEILNILRSRDITDASIMRIAECCPNLRQIVMPCPKITDASVIQIAVLI